MNENTTSRLIRFRPHGYEEDNLFLLPSVDAVSMLGQNRK